MLLTVPEDAGLVLIQPPVFRQCLGVPGPQLAQGQIHEPPPLRRPRPDEKQILRAEEYGVQHVGQRRVGLSGHTVDRHFPAFAAKELYIRGERPLPGQELRRDGRLLPVEADQLPVAVGAGAFTAGQIDHGLQQVGLALGVLAVDDVAAPVEVQRLPPVIAPAVQRQLIDPHR